MEDTFDLDSTYKQFIKFEEENDLFSKKIGGIYFWERIRFPIGRMILYPQLFQLKENDKTPFLDKVTKKIQKILKYLKSILYIHRNPFLVKKKDILVFGHERRKLKEDGKWWDIYTDHFLEELNYSYVSLENDFKNKFLVPPKTKNLKYITFLNVLTNIKRFLTSATASIPIEEENYLKKLEIKLEDEFGLRIHLTEYVKNMLIRRKRILPLYEKIIKKIDPKIVLIVVSYGKENFIEACKNLNIPVIELQHGVISKYHIGYSYESIKSKKESFPDYFLSFGEYWNKKVKFPIEQSRVISVGFPEFEKQKHKYKNKKKKKQIVFLSQPIEGGIKLSEIAAKLHQTENFLYDVHYKLHPTENLVWEQWYPLLKETNVNIITSQGKDLYEIFAESEIQVGLNSTALYEGLGFNLRTLLLKDKVTPYMQDLIDKGYAKLVETKEDIINYTQKKEKKEIEPESFFKSESIKNMIAEIEKIMKNYTKNNV